MKIARVALHIAGGLFAIATGLLGLAIPVFAWASIAAEHEWRHAHQPHFWGVLAYVAVVASAMAICFGLAYISLLYAVGKHLPHRRSTFLLH